MSIPSLAIYGLGRAGLALASSSQSAAIPLQVLWTRSQQRAAHASAILNRTVDFGLPFPPAQQADIVILAVNDPHITPMAAALTQAGILENVITVSHLAGGYGAQILREHVPATCRVGAIHPARALGTGPNAWQGCFCALDGDAEAIRLLTRVAHALGCSSAQVDEAHRPLYHAACALAGNDVGGLVAAAAGIFSQLGFADELAERVAIDLTQSAAQNFHQASLAEGLTGAVRRGDVELLRKHLHSLNQYQPTIAALHRSCSLLLLQHLRAKGDEPAVLDALEQILVETR